MRNTSAFFDSRTPLLYVLILSIAGGPYLLSFKLAGYTLFGFRLAALGTLSYLLISRHKLPLQKTLTTISFLTLMTVWITWGALSYFWAPDLAEWASDILNLAIGTAFVTNVFLLTSSHPNGLRHLRFAWSLAYLASLFVAIWEKKSGLHLASQWVSAASAPALANLVQSTFSNPNNYAAFGVFSIPVFLWGIHEYWRKKNSLNFWYYSLVIATVPIIFYLTASRLALAALLAQIVILFFWHARNIKLLARWSIALIVAGFFTMNFLQANPILLLKIGNMSSEIGNTRGSIGSRINLTKAGIWMLGESSGFGVGAGGFTSHAKDLHQPHPVGRLSNAHNYWIEIASQYGLFILLLVVAFIVSLGWMTIICASYVRNYGNNQLPSIIHSGMIFTPMLWATYVIISATHSSFITNHVNWATLAMLLTVVSHAQWYINKFAKTESS